MPFQQFSLQDVLFWVPNRQPTQFSSRSKDKIEYNFQKDNHILDI
jgi:hypothetical protein